MWDPHVSEIVGEASKRLHILRVLRTFNISPKHGVTLQSNLKWDLHASIVNRANWL